MTNPPRADWRQIDAAYRQVSSAASAGTSDGPSDRLAGHLAHRLGRTFTHYDRAENDFIADLLACWAAADGLQRNRSGFKKLYYDKRFNSFPAYNTTDGNRRRPKPFEAAIETVRRLVTVNSIRDATIDLPAAGILGGSASYGRFFNTKGASNDASDLDLMVVLPDLEDSLAAFAERLRRVPGASHEDVEALLNRIPLAAAHSAECSHMSMSHKLRFWDDERDPLLEPYDVPGDFETQLHIFPKAAFCYMLLVDLPVIETSEDEPELHRAMWDFRDDLGRRKSETIEYCFASTPLRSSREIRTVSGGHLAEETVCRVTDERFYPGVFHNIVMPQFEVRWDRTDFNARLMVLGFRGKMLDRLARERQLRPWEDQTLANSHIRSRVFAPHVWRKVLNSSGHLS